MSSSARDPFELDRDTAPTADGFVVTDHWSIGDAPNGGYLAVGVARHLAGMRPLQSLSIHYLRPARPGPSVVSTTILREGRASSVVSGALRQGGDDVLVATAILSDPPSGLGRTPAPPTLPDPERCVRGRPGPTDRLPIADRVDMRLAPGAVSWGGRREDRSDVGELGGWVRFADGRPIDPTSLLFFADCFPSPVLNLRHVEADWVPTLEMSVQLFALPPTTWLRGWFRVATLQGSVLVEEGDLFADDGSHVATVRQLARLHRAR